MKQFILSLIFTIIAAPAMAAVTVGGPAPEFTLLDQNGTSHSLSDFKGKVVVLEWTNYECPFVKKFYGAGKMQELQKTYTEKDVIWLSINSSAEGKEGYLTQEEAAAAFKSHNANSTALLRDADGKVGQLYGAKTTPHMYVINADGNLIYMGAIDSKASVDAADIEGATNHVADALDAIMAGKDVAVPVTKPYGCSVKYAK